MKKYELKSLKFSDFGKKKVKIEAFFEKGILSIFADFQKFSDKGIKNFVEGIEQLYYDSYDGALWDLKWPNKKK